MGKYATARQLASLHKVDARTVQRRSDPQDRLYIKGYDKEGRGQYDIVKCTNALIDYYNSKIDALEGGSLRNSKERKEAALAENAEFDLAARRKEIIKVDDAITLFEKILNNYTSRTSATKKLSVPKLLIAKDDKAVTQILESRDNELINELTNTIENIIRGMVESSNQDHTHTRPGKTARRRKAK
jgi:hypothetical protein